MFDAASLTIFISATIILIVVPGPSILYIVARSLEQGRMAGIISSLGINLSGIPHVIFAAFGLSAILMKSALAFSIIKYLGAIYLIYLGIRTLTSKAQNPNVQNVQAMNHSKLFSQGFLVGLLNPKTALFFLAFLPQFVDPTRAPAVQQIIFLGILFLTFSLIGTFAYALIAGTVRQLLSRSLRVARIQKYVAGTTYIALGLTTAFSGSGRSK